MYSAASGQRKSQWDSAEWAHGPAVWQSSVRAAARTASTSTRPIVTWSGRCRSASPLMASAGAGPSAAALTKTEVRDKLRELREDIASGVQGPASCSVQQTVDDWLNDGLDGRSAATVTKYRHVLKPMVELSAADATGSRSCCSSLAFLAEGAGQRGLQHPFLASCRPWCRWPWSTPTTALPAAARTAGSRRLRSGAKCTNDAGSSSGSPVLTARPRTVIDLPRRNPPARSVSRSARAQGSSAPRPSSAGPRRAVRHLVRLYQGLTWREAALV